MLYTLLWAFVGVPLACCFIIGSFIWAHSFFHNKLDQLFSDITIKDYINLGLRLFVLCFVFVIDVVVLAFVVVNLVTSLHNW
jgi:hypothetical protein